MKPRTASERAAAKAAGIDDQHPADRLKDPLAARLADQAAKPPARAALKHLGGSDHDAFNVSLAETVLSAAWTPYDGDRDHMLQIVEQSLAGIAPQNEVEGMIAGQMVAAHQASLECYRRAMLPEQTIESRGMNLKMATKASATFAALLDSLNRHRGKGGEQRCVVEHVHKHIHVYENGSPIVDHIDTPGGGGQIENKRQSHAPALGHQPSTGTAMWSQDSEREPVSQSGDDKRPLQDARRHKPRRAQRGS